MSQRSNPTQPCPLFKALQGIMFGSRFCACRRTAHASDLQQTWLAVARSQRSPVWLPHPCTVYLQEARGPIHLCSPAGPPCFFSCRLAYSHSSFFNFLPAGGGGSAEGSAAPAAAGAGLLCPPGVLLRGEPPSAGQRRRLLERGLPVCAALQQLPAPAAQAEAGEVPCTLIGVGLTACAAELGLAMLTA